MTRRISLVAVSCSGLGQLAVPCLELPDRLGEAFSRSRTRASAGFCALRGAARLALPFARLDPDPFALLLA
jgi:hypothetical protein